MELTMTMKKRNPPKIKVCYNFKKKGEVIKMAVVPLDINSTYSLLQSTIRPKELAAAARQRGYSAMALTDNDVLYGAVDFYKAAQESQISPIIGAKFNISLNDIDDQKISLTAIASDLQGYENLMQLSTMRMTSDVDLTREDLSHYIEHCFIIVNPTPPILGAQGDQEAAQFLKWLSIQDVQSFLGINLTLDETMRQVVQDLAKQYRLPTIADERVDYLNPDQYFSTQVLRSISSGNQIQTPLEVSSKRGAHYLRTAEELTKLYNEAGLQEAVKNNELLVQSSGFKMNFQKPVLPHFPVPGCVSSADYLRQLCIDGLKKRQLAPHMTIQDYKKRLDHELTVIHQMNFDDYFLIVWDVMDFIHRSKIMTGPGRGSAAGSLVAYALAITDVDPLQYGLLFERFLNPERAQMPDIDLDIPDNRRQQVLGYVHKRYGHSRVAQIITFGTLAARQVVRDVGRVFGVPQYQIEQIIDILRPLTRHRSITLAEAVKDSQPLRNLIIDNPMNRLIIQTAQQLEGLPRHYSTHAAGVVLSASPLRTIVPLQKGNDEEGLLMTQFPKEIVESVGLLKMDFLGLRNLSIMDKAMQLIRQKDPDFDITTVPLNDQTTIQLFQKGATDGIFQFESTGIRQTLINLQPDSFEDIVAVNALYRPGPLENIPHFIARKHGQEKIVLPDESLQPILGPTYGILVYQEQVMQVASKMAGFSLGQADLLRRAMSKKKQATMESMRGRFINGAVQNGYSKQIATQVFDYIDQFANYGFNRSHAVAYSKMAYEMAYLKCHYPAEFFTALLSIEPNINKEQLHLADAKKFGLKIKGPDINQSQESFSLINGDIQMGFTMIKGMRRDFIQAIMDERQRGPFKNLGDFVQRMGDKWQKENLINPLIYSGAFDHLGYNRAEMIEGLSGLFAGNEFAFKSADLQPMMERRKEYPLTYRLLKEKEYLGVYISGHPVAQYQKVRERIRTQRVSDIKVNEHVKMLVMINQLRQINTKKTHQPMAFASVSDETGSVDVTIFPDQYQRYVDIVQPSRIVLINGTVEFRNNRPQVIANEIIPVQRLITTNSKSNQRWVVRIVKGQSQSKLLHALKENSSEISGSVPVVVFDEASNKANLLDRSMWLQSSSKSRELLNKIFGSANVVLQAID